MKLAYSIMLPDSEVNMLAYRGEVKQSLEKLKDIGYDGVELIVRKPSELNVSDLVKQIEKSNLDVCSVGTAPILAEDKLSLINPSYEVRKAAVTRTKEIVDFASIFGATVNIGKFRGDLLPENRVESWKWLRENITEICEYAGKNNVLVTIEPQNRATINNINTTQEALIWIENLNLINLFILSDTFHMDIEEKSITDSLLEAGHNIKHIHVADSNRNIPGKGNINFLEIVRTLKAIHYNDYLSLEIMQGINGLENAEKAWIYLNNLCRKLV